MYNTKNFDNLVESILNTSKNLNLEITDTSHHDNSTYEICGKRSNYDYGGSFIDLINIDIDNYGKNGAIEIIVNGYSYILVHDFKTNENTCSKAKVYINGMYYCLSEKDRKPVTEQTFKRAIERFVKRNDIESLRNKCKVENEL